jgi:hypothetical protein
LLTICRQGAAMAFALVSKTAAAAIPLALALLAQFAA